MADLAAGRYRGECVVILCRQEVVTGSLPASFGMKNVRLSLLVCVTTLDPSSIIGG